MATTLPALRKLCLNPIFSVEGTLDGLPNEAVEFKEGKGSHSTIVTFCPQKYEKRTKRQRKKLVNRLFFINFQNKDLL